jgi:hypothetical protein
MPHVYQNKASKPLLRFLICMRKAGTSIPHLNFFDSCNHPKWTLAETISEEDLFGNHVVIYMTAGLIVLKLATLASLDLRCFLSVLAEPLHFWLHCRTH